jgi:hypothetical protein
VHWFCKKSVSSQCHSTSNVRLTLGSKTGVPSDSSAVAGCRVQSSQEGHTALANILLAQEGVDPNFRVRRRPFLVMAAMRGHVDMVELLLATKGVNPDIEVEESMEWFGWTALSFSASRGEPWSQR